MTKNEFSTVPGTVIVFPAGLLFWHTVGLNLVYMQCCGSGIWCIFGPGIRDEHPVSYFRELRRNFWSKIYLNSLMRIQFRDLESFWPNNVNNCLNSRDRVSNAGQISSLFCKTKSIFRKFFRHFLSYLRGPI
jgi:hypothetical protein